jgi:hypothetical protein
MECLLCGLMRFLSLSARLNGLCRLRGFWNGIKGKVGEGSGSCSGSGSGFRFHVKADT